MTDDSDSYFAVSPVLIAYYYRAYLSIIYTMYI